MNKRLLSMSSVALLSAVMFFEGCSDSGKQDEKSDESIEKSLDVDVDTNANRLIKFNNVIFSVPSPYQFAFFVKDLGVSYNREYLNSTKNVSSYSSTFKKALNMGIYGTDLGYLNIYEQVPDAIQYFSALKMLAQDVGIASTFDANTIQRIEKNMGRKDSLLFILSNKYREADAYLKDNDRNAIAVLILAGGWMESLYILTEVSKDKPSEAISQKIAEQKHPLDNLIKILTPYYNQSQEYTQMVDQLIELAYEYDGVEYKYEFKPSTTDAANKITTINSVSKLTINKDQLKNISEKIGKLRNSIVK